MKVSIIVTTYNWPEALRVVLGSIVSQSTSPNDVIVADDGSKEETADLVRKILGKSQLTWKHVRHGDSGIRQARVKNLGAKYAEGDYFIFVDQDVVLHPEFVKDHIASSGKGLFLQGKRAFLPSSYTEKLLKGEIKFTPPFFWLKGLENRKNAIHCPSVGRLFGTPKGFQTSLRGCNISMHKSDFLAIDGYDETFDIAWGREDSDVCYRLFHNGVKIKNLWFNGLQYHLDHKVIKNRAKDMLDDELKKICSEKRTRAVKGFSALSAEGEIVSES